MSDGVAKDMEDLRIAGPGPSASAADKLQFVLVDGHAGGGGNAALLDDAIPVVGRLKGGRHAPVKIFRHDQGIGMSFDRLTRWRGIEQARAILSQEHPSDASARSTSEPGKLIQPACPSMPIDASVARSMDQASLRIDRLAHVVSEGEDRGISIIGTQVDRGSHLQAAGLQLASVIRGNQARTAFHPAGAADRKQSVGILTGFAVRDARGHMLGGENDGPPGAVVMAKVLLDHQTPVHLVTDENSEHILLESLVGADLARARPGVAAPARIADYVLNDQVSVHVAAVPDMIGVEAAVAARIAAAPRRGDAQAAFDDAVMQELTRRNATEVKRIKSALRAANTTTMVSIERPSPNVNGIMTNMHGQDIRPFNADLSGLLRRGRNWSPYRIGIGDGGNELGMGSISDQIATMRRPNQDLAVNNGDNIAAHPGIKPDALILSSVSNNGGIAVAMATGAGLGQAEAGDAIGVYDRVIRHLERKGLSLDGVTGTNALTIDNRALGEMGGTAQAPGDPRATHHDVFRVMMTAMQALP